MKKEKPSLFSQSYQKEWSETHKYKHIHTGEYCTFESYIAEFIVLRRADKLKLPKPGYKFWTKGDPNHWLWMKQFNAAIALKKKYSEEAVIKAVNSEEFEKLLVIGIQNGRGWKINPLAEKIVLLYHNKMLEQKAEVKQDIEIENLPESKSQIVRAKQYSNKKSTINKLRNL